jgi:DNA-binding XRE family transcriptional regulator
LYASLHIRMKQKWNKPTISGISIDADKIRIMRVRRGLSQEDLSCEIDCERQEITKLENNLFKNPSLCMAWKLAQFFNVKLEEILK